MRQITNFDPEFPNSLDDILRFRTKNSINLLSLQASDANIGPIQRRQSLYPSEFQSKISVPHEGVNINININIAKPYSEAVLTLPNEQKLTT